MKSIINIFVNKWEYFKEGAVLSFFLIAVAGFILEPFTGDLYVLMGGARLADYWGGNIIYNSFMQWDLKGVLFRLSNYIIYRIATLFVTIPSREFEITCLSIYVIFVCFLCMLIMHLIMVRESFNIKIINGLYLSLAILTMQIACRMQAEMTCTMLFALSFALYVNANITEKNVVFKTIVSGIIIGCSLFFKTPLILLTISFVASIAIWERYYKYQPCLQRYFLLAFGSTISIILLGTMVFWINPSEYGNIIAAATYQKTLITSSVPFWEVIIEFGYGMLLAVIGIPVLLLGSLSFLITLMKLVKQRKMIEVSMHVVMWLVPFIYIVLSNCYFRYHYVVFVGPAMFEVYMISHSLNTYTLKSKEKLLLFLTFVFIFISVPVLKMNNGILYYSKNWIIFGCFFTALILINIFFLRHSISFRFSFLIPLALVTFIYMNWISIFSFNASNYISMDVFTIKQLNRLNISNNLEILYLDSGLGAYYLGNKSYLKEYYPLPLQRISEKSLLTNKPYYQIAKQRSMQFKGKYIIIDKNWFLKYGNNNAIMNKIDSEYIQDMCFYTFQIPFNLFQKCDSTSLTECAVYKKRNSDSIF